MLNFRDFEAGPDPFGRKFHVLLKWMQTAISLRHADTIDVKFVLEEEGGARSEKTIAIPHADLLRVSKELNRPVDDAWCTRLAALHLMYVIETGEDMEKSLVTILPQDLKRHAEKIGEMERAEVHAR